MQKSLENQDSPGKTVLQCMDGTVYLPLKVFVQWPQRRPEMSPTATTTRKRNKPTPEKPLKTHDWPRMESIQQMERSICYICNSWVYAQNLFFFSRKNKGNLHIRFNAKSFTSFGNVFNERNLRSPRKWLYYRSRCWFWSDCRMFAEHATREKMRDINNHMMRLREV